MQRISIAVSPSLALRRAQAKLDAASDADGPSVVANGGSPWTSIRYDLERDQGGLCAYCEDKLRERMTEVDHIRPKSKSAYWWLAYQVRNLVATCRTCNNAKSEKCEVAAGSRKLTPRNEPWNIVETLMLIDPTRESPDDHLTYLNVAGSWHIAPLTARGAWTIKELELDRDSFLSTINRQDRLLIAPEVGRIKQAIQARDRASLEQSRNVLSTLIREAPFPSFTRRAIQFHVDNE